MWLTPANMSDATLDRALTTARDRAAHYRNVAKVSAFPGEYYTSAVVQEGYVAELEAELTVRAETAKEILAWEGECNAL